MNVISIILSIHDHKSTNNDCTSAVTARNFLFHQVYHWNFKVLNNN